MLRCPRTGALPAALAFYRERRDLFIDGCSSRLEILPCEGLISRWRTIAPSRIWMMSASPLVNHRNRRRGDPSVGVLRRSVPA